MKNNLIILISLLAIVFFTNCNKDAAEAASATGAGGSTARFTISGNYLYVVNSTNVKTFDISNTSASPVLKSTIDVGVNVETIFPYQDKLFIGSSQAMHIFSLSQPDRPSRLAQADYPLRRACDPVVAKDSVAYATLNGSGRCGGGRSSLVVYDIRDITKPMLKAEMPLSGPYGLGISDSALYVCDGLAGLEVFNIRNPYSPLFIRKITSEKFYDVIPYGNILICQVATGIALFDISTRHNPVLISRILN